MKYIMLMLLAGAFSISIYSKGIVFENGNFEEALIKAKAENKIVFVDCYTSWCGPCKMMAKTVFTQEEVGEFFNANFVSLKIDMEKGEGPEFATKYGVQVYPTFLFIDSTGKLIQSSKGGMVTNKFIAEAERAQKSK